MLYKKDVCAGPWGRQRWVGGVAQWRRKWDQQQEEPPEAEAQLDVRRIKVRSIVDQGRRADIFFITHACSILRQSSIPLCGFSSVGSSMMEQVRLGDVWPFENWLGSSMNHTGFDDFLRVLQTSFRRNVYTFVQIPSPVYPFHARETAWPRF